MSDLKETAAHQDRMIPVFFPCDCHVTSKLSLVSKCSICSNRSAVSPALQTAATNTWEKATRSYSFIVLPLLKALFFTLSQGIVFTWSPTRSDSVIMENVSHYFAYLQGILEGLLKFQPSFYQINKDILRLFSLLGVFSARTLFCRRGISAYDL